MNNKVVVASIIIMLVLIMILPGKSFCIDTGKYEKIYKDSKDGGTLLNKGGEILGIIQTIGIGIAVIMLIVIGIKIIVASPQEKADIKEALTPYLIGTILLFAGSGILSIIVNLIREI